MAWRHALRTCAFRAAASTPQLLQPRAFQNVLSVRTIITIKKSPVRTPEEQDAASFMGKKRTKAMRPGAAAAAVDGPPVTMRLAKRIAHSGLCSRREAEKFIQSFDVLVNGKVVADVATVVDLHRDIVKVNGRTLPGAMRTKVWLVNKLPGELVTANDPQGRPTIFSRLQQMGLNQHLMPVGRLDFNTEGLLLLTNDGEYARKLEHPDNEVVRVYRALVRGDVAETKIAELQRGPLVDGIKYRPIHVTVQSQEKKDSWLQVRLSEGKNREVRKALAHVRLVLKRLIRVQYGPYRLADLSAGSVLEVRPKELDAKPSSNNSTKHSKPRIKRPARKNAQPESEV
ncbi:TPA: hypothetical protein N0F65_002370 [Lagenidium giganteum]|uniref:RNA-binding S4 domain-containing protein n=1 Tax=Lagenidium giganteum TaxID=4803 RepID=A0AAV2YPH6_9STRA|nr:TPA: hypothetical protein N0F65_002370 [Lagenidium giganteum]